MTLTTPARITLALMALWLAPAWPAAAADPLPVKTVTFEAPSVGRTLKYKVILPANYEAGSDRYPVLYMLHGLTGNYLNWSRMQVPKFARRHDLIVVMADAGNSWYVNWAKPDADSKEAWEDCIVKDLIGHVDSTYRTVASREGRAVSGLSMGGYGALTLGLRHPDVFCSVASHSGAVSFARRIGERLKSGEDLPAPKNEPSNEPNPAIGIEGFSSPAERTPKGKIFETAEQAAAYDPFALLRTVPKEAMPHIFVNCGTEDRLIASNQELVKLLMELKIPFTYAESVGGHNPEYWAREVANSMAIQASVMDRALARKAAKVEAKAAE